MNISRRVLGWSGGYDMLTELVTHALAQAVAARGGQLSGTIMHSGLAEPSTPHGRWSRRALDVGLRWSMGATGICWDNSGAESLWSTFKHEHHYRHTFATKVELVAAVDKWRNFQIRGVIR